MDPGNVPEELKDLTFIEERLIARVNPMLSVFKLKGMQYGYRGNVINYPQNVQEIADQLPRKISDISAMINARVQKTDGRYHDFRVRAGKVKNALIWLKNNNKYYSDIQIKNENVEALPDDGNAIDELCKYEDIEDNEENIAEGGVADDELPDNGEDDFEEDVYETGVAHTHYPHQDDQIKNHIKWASFNAKPVDEFKTLGYMTCAFPTLFPNGKGDFRDDRAKEIKPGAYFKHLMHYHDRFAQHKTFRFFAYNTWMRWTALNDGNVFVANSSEFKNITVAKLRDLLENNNGLIKKIMFMASNLKGTKKFWNARANELRSMTEQLGLPTFFLTLSCADHHWSKLFRLLTGLEDISKLTEKERRDLIQNNPQTVDAFFDRRIESYVKNVSGDKIIFNSFPSMLL